MTQVNEAIARYHKILEAEPYRNLAWVEALREQMRLKHLVVAGRPVSPFLRPHFITRRQYTNLVKAAECLLTAINRVKTIALSTPSLMSRMELLPAEKMLAGVNPGYSHAAVTSLLDTHLNNGTLRFVDYSAEMPVGAIYGELLSDLFYDIGPMKDFRKKNAVVKMHGSKYLIQALNKAFKEFGGPGKAPKIGILEFKQSFSTVESNESVLLMEFLRKQGLETEIVTPETLDYRNGILRKGDFVINLIYRRLKVQEFLVKYDLSHPLVRAYREGKVCVINSFRSEVAQKKAIFDLLTDETITAQFPTAEKKAIRDFIPWTRVVGNVKTTWHDDMVDLPEFILQNRETLVMRPNDDGGEQQTYEGWAMDASTWERALKTAMRSTYVVQEKVPPVTAPFPLQQYGNVEVREMRVDVQPHAFLGKVQGCSSWLSSANQGFSTVAGPAPTYILDSR